MFSCNSELTGVKNLMVLYFVCRIIWEVDRVLRNFMPCSLLRSRKFLTECKPREVPSKKMLIFAHTALRESYLVITFTVITRKLLWSVPKNCAGINLGGNEEIRKCQFMIVGLSRNSNLRLIKYIYQANRFLLIENTWII